MNFDLTDEERALQTGIRALCRSDDLPDHPAARSSEGGVSRDEWKTLAEYGVFSIRLPEPDGTALGLAQATLLFEELGRANVPGPAAASHLAAGEIDGAATGASIVGLVERTAAPIVLEHLPALDAVVVVDDDGLWTLDARSLAGHEVAPLDPLTPMFVVDTLPQGDRLEGPDVAGRWRSDGAVLTAAFEVGLAAAATDAAVAYAKQREQFGRPIGSFQAVKHLCADMLVRTEVARVAVHSAAVLVDDGHDDALRAVAGAKLLADDAAFRNGKDCIQVHGGMGFTWEAKVHLYVKRAAVLRTHFLGHRAQAAMLAEAL
jgi:alkylation response protein AidB-like acyl-CoA dehydrogenase